jgi:IS5 family transposase
MPHRSLQQSSFFDAQFLDPGCLGEGTLAWLLARERSCLLPDWLFEGWRGEGTRGRNAWPAQNLMAMLLLRRNFAGPMSRRESCRQAKHNLTWRAAMGLAIGGDTPSERTLRRFERFLGQRHEATGVPRYLLVHEHIVRVCRGEGAVDERARWVIDSTPMWCYGAALDTIRLLGDGLRMLVRSYARWTKTPLTQVVEDYELPVVVAKTTKGAFEIDWRNPDARSGVVHELACQVLRAVDFIRRELQRQPLQGVHRKKLLQGCARVAKVIRDDLELDEQGRWVVARGTASKRLVSITDPQAGHGRKTRSQTYKGFKTHVLGDAVSGLITAVAVAPAHVHDQQPAQRLIRRTKNLCAELEQVLADTAYGGAELRHVVYRGEGVRLLAPPPPATMVGKLFGKDRFDIDFETGTATCPNGETSHERTFLWSSDHQRRVPRYQWPAKGCDGCPLSSECRGASREKRRLVLHPYEKELREAKQQWQDPAIRKQYRERSRGERLINLMTQHGGRRAASWGLLAANLQAHTIATASNLTLLARLRLARLRREAEPRPLAAA